MRLEAHEVLAIVGKRGMGKSHEAKALCGSELEGGARVVAFDPHDEYSQLGKKNSQVTLGPLTQRCTVEQLIENPSILDKKKLSLAVVPEGRSNRELAEVFNEVAEVISTTGKLTLVADEVGEYEKDAYDMLNSLATQSRHYETAIVFVAQRMTQIPKTARTQISELRIFKQSNPEDLEALVKLTGDKDLAAKVSRLPKRKFLTWRDSEEVTTP